MVFHSCTIAKMSVIIKREFNVVRLDWRQDVIETWKKMIRPRDQVYFFFAISQVEQKIMRDQLSLQAP